MQNLACWIETLLTWSSIVIRFQARNKAGGRHPDCAFEEDQGKYILVWVVDLPVVRNVHERQERTTNFVLLPLWTVV
jgi:hypothetical protein